MVEYQLETLVKNISTGQFVDGTNTFSFTVPSGMEWLIAGGYLRIKYHGAATNNQYIRFRITSNVPGAIGNTILDKYIAPWLATDGSWHYNIGPNEEDAQMDDVKIDATQTFKVRTIGTPDIALTDGYAIVVQCHNQVALDGDSLIMNLTVLKRPVSE